MFQFNYVSTNALGPPDLLHYGIYAGVRSSLFKDDDFVPAVDMQDKDDDGYVGYYHFVNGLNHATNSYHAIENYIFSAIGIEWRNPDYHWILNFELDSKREVVVTYCSYNIFGRCDLRIKYVISCVSLSKKTVLIDKSFQIIPNDGSKVTSSFNLNKLSPTIWDELNCSLLIRLFIQLDRPSYQLPGLVSLNEFTGSTKLVESCIILLIKNLQKGYLTDSDPFYGPTSGCVDRNKSIIRTSVYRNRLVDTLLRLCDSGGFKDNNRLINLATSEITKINKYGDWNFVKLKLLKLSDSGDKQIEFVNLCHEALSDLGIFTTQSCLILLEQVKFLISRKDYSSALKIATTTIKILPLDFECWFYVAMCYALLEDYERGLMTMNSFPMALTGNNVNIVSGIFDEFSATFMQKFNTNLEPISEKTFLKYFPQPGTYVNSTIESTDGRTEGKTKILWEDLFIFDPNTRHPTCGNEFYQSPLISKSAKETSMVDSNLIKLIGPNSLKMKLSAYSSNSSNSSILDFTKRSTWGRTYDLLSFIVARIGWDSTLNIKNKTFNRNASKYSLIESKEDLKVTNGIRRKANCEGWLDQLFLILVQDLKILTSINSPDREQNHSYLEWEILGLLGWNVKYNLKGSISSLITSVMSDLDKREFNYFGSVQLLMLYDEFMLSEVNSCQIDIYTDDYSKACFTNKLILKQSENLFEYFNKSMDKSFLTLDLVLLLVMKLLSWNIRWYQFVPDYLVTKILHKLCIIHSPEYIITKMKILFEQNKKSERSTGGFFRWSQKKKDDSYKYFDSNDTIVLYIEKIIY